MQASAGTVEETGEAVVAASISVELALGYPASADAAVADIRVVAEAIQVEAAPEEILRAEMMERTPRRRPS